jgi:hypothetical protein
MTVVALIWIIWVAGAFLATWINAARTGAVPLLGPLICVRRSTHRVLYYLSMGVLLAPTLVGTFLAIAGLVWAVRVGEILRLPLPSPPRGGYVERASLPIQKSQALSGYFAPDLARITYRCPNARPQTLLSPFEAAWFSEHLAAAGETSILEILPSRKNVYRLLWLRSFDKPMIVRVEEAENGRYRLDAKLLSGKGGYEPGIVEAQIHRTLTDAEQRKFSRVLARAKQLRIPAVACNRGYDGAEWVLEGSDGGIYRFAVRWAPKKGDVHELGITMLGFTGWPLDPIY